MLHFRPAIRYAIERKAAPMVDSILSRYLPSQYWQYICISEADGSRGIGVPSVLEAEGDCRKHSMLLRAQSEHGVFAFLNEYSFEEDTSV